ncbi:MAG: hypothetical protein PHU65_05320 [Actinomycetota bacterium]|jgi:hypothetical protein|nr:hypothetical protein [Actinomycetota bacterium]
MNLKENKNFKSDADFFSEQKISSVKKLTGKQKQTARDIFSKYNLSKLTKSEAQVILKQLENAGIHGLGISEAAKDAGLDPNKFWSLTYGSQQRGASGKW